MSHIIICNNNDDSNNTWATSFTFSAKTTSLGCESKLALSLSGLHTGAFDAQLVRF